MTKDVLVSVQGLHRVDDDFDKLEVITPGSYYLKNGKHYIVYDEFPNDEGSIRNTIRIKDDCVEMIKSGDIRAHMIFKENHTDLSSYNTPFGNMTIGVTTEKLIIEEDADSIKVRIDYALAYDDEVCDHSHIDIDVSSRAAAKLNLKEKE